VDIIENSSLFEDFYIINKYYSFLRNKKPLNMKQKTQITNYFSKKDRITAISLNEIDKIDKYFHEIVIKLLFQIRDSRPFIVQDIGQHRAITKHEILS
jgi:hypothetical protein